MAGADVTQLCAALLQNGVEHLGVILKDMEAWMEEHEYASIAQMKGSMSHKSGGRTGRLRARQLHEGAEQLSLIGPLHRPR